MVSSGLPGLATPFAAARQVLARQRGRVLVPHVGFRAGTVSQRAGVVAFDPFPHCSYSLDACRMAVGRPLLRLVLDLVGDTALDLI